MLELGLSLWGGGWGQGEKPTPRGTHKIFIKQTSERVFHTINTYAHITAELHTILATSEAVGANFQFRNSSTGTHYVFSMFVSNLWTVCLSVHSVDLV